jgi:hypothetical protein
MNDELTELTALYDHGDLVQCSSSNEHCFLCDNVDPGGSDNDAAAIRKFVKELVAQKKELPFVINSVYMIYSTEMESSTQQSWSRASIKRHLLFSTEFQSLFNSVVDQLFISIIMRTQAHMVNEFGGVDDHARKALIESISALSAWRKAVKSL